MGENEQGGMLRTVIVVGIIALIAAVITLGVVSLKSNMHKNTNKAVGAVATATVPFSSKHHTNYVSKEVSLSSDNTVFPIIGDIPPNSWREVHIEFTVDKPVNVQVDINDSYGTNRSSTNDNDDLSKRELDIYQNGVLTQTKFIGKWTDASKFIAQPNINYVMVVKYFNNTADVFTENESTDLWQHTPNLWTKAVDGSAYQFNIKSFEAATYDDIYNDN